MKETEIEIPPKRGRGNPTGRNQWDMNAMYQIKHVQAKSLLDQGKTYKQIQAATGLSEPTIANISKGRIDVSPSWVKSIKSVESQKLTYLIHAFLDSITPEKIQACSAPQAITCAAIILDKRRLIDGEPTATIMHADLISTLAEDRNTLMRQLNSIDKISTLPTENVNALVSRDNEC